MMDLAAWGWPQFVMAFLFAFSWGVSVARYGEQKRDRYDIVDVLVAPISSLVILYYGGFWK